MKRKIFSILLILVLACSFSLVTAVPVAVAANGPNPTFCTVDMDFTTTPSTEISIGWERDPGITGPAYDIEGGVVFESVDGAFSGTDAIRVTTSTATSDFAMVIVPTDFTFGVTEISYWGYTVSGDVIAPDEIYLFLDAIDDGEAFDTLLTSHKPTYGGTTYSGTWREWNSTDPLNHWHIVDPNTGYTEANPDTYSGARVLAIALTAGPSTTSGAVNVDVYFDQLTVDGDVLLDDDTGIIDVPVPFPGQLAPSIQDAIDAALPGTTISVAEGTYDESGLKINKSLTISGTGSVTITGTKGSFDTDLKFHGTGAPGTKVLGSMDYVVGVYNSADVDFVNVTIDGANNLSAPAGDQYFAGVAFYNAHGSFSGCEIKRTASNPAYCGGAAVSIYIDTDSGTWELEVSSNCTFNTWPKNAISAYGSGSTLSNVLTVDVDDSTFTGNDGSGPSDGLQNGIVGLGGLDMEVDNCTFSAIRPTGGTWWAAPVLAGYAYKDEAARYAPAHDLTVNDCTFSVTGDKFVRRSGGVWIITTGTATVSDCTFTNIKGIVVDGSNSCEGVPENFNPSSQDVTISICTFNGPSFPSSINYYMCGVNIQRGAQVDIEDCSFSGFDDDGSTAVGMGGDAVCFNLAHFEPTYYTGSCGGSVTDSTFSGCSTGIWVDEDVTPLTISNNNFDGSNEYGIWNADETPDEITATNNWWGNATGPKQAATNPSASGDGVTDNVNYSPWLDAASPGGSERTYNVENTDTFETFNSIQAAIDDADTDAEDTIQVYAGTYDLIAPIAVTESVTITGDITGDIDTPSNVVINAPITGDDRDCFQVKASGVTIQGFTIQGALDAPGLAPGTQNSGIVIGDWWVGAAIPGLQNIVISYNEITNCSKGISVYRAQHVTISYNRIHHCPTSDVRPGSWPGKGILLYGDGSANDPQDNDIDILDNQIYDNELMGIELNYSETSGAWVDADVLIDTNIIYNNGGSWNHVGWDTTSAQWEVYRGISANGKVTGVTINNNELYNHGSGTGTAFREDGSSGAIRVASCKGWTITDNDIYDNMRGIHIYDGEHHDLLDSNTGHVITGNNIYGNAQGIATFSGDVGYAQFNNIHDNNVTTWQTDGIVPYGAVNLDAGTFDATNNWWGDASGPIHVGTNPLATGNEVSDNVDYDPWFGAGVEDSKSKKTGTADETVNAKDEADTEVVKSGTGTPTITVSEFKDNPGDGAPGGFSSAGKYIDVHLDTTEDVTEIEIRNYYTPDDIAGLREATLRLSWWDGTDWIRCSHSGATYPEEPTELLSDPYRGYVWAKIRAPGAIPPTIPTLADLAGTPFMSMGRPPTPVGGGGGGGGAPPAPPAGTTDVRGEVSTGCVFLRSATATSEDELCSLNIPADTVGLTEELECLDEITMLIMDDPPAPPQGANVIGLVYDFGPDGATFDPPITLTFNYDPADIPEGIAEEDLVLAYYDEAAGEWIVLEGYVVDPETNTITAPLSHFTAFGAMFIPAPAAFSFSDLKVSPAEVEVGSPVTISTLVENTGGQTGSYALMLRIDGVAEEIKEITLDAGASERVTFTTVKDVAGSYSVEVDGLAGSFTLKEKPAPPTAPPPEEEPLPTAKPPVPWAAVWGVIAAAVVVVGLGVFFWIRRRAY